MKLHQLFSFVLFFEMLLFFIWIGLCYSLNVGYLRKSSDVDHTLTIDKFKSLTTGFVYNEYTYTDGTDFKDTTKKMVEDGKDLIFAQCSEEMFDYESQEVANSEIVIWCLNAVSTGRCSKSFISGVSVIPVIEDRILFILYF